MSPRGFALILAAFTVNLASLARKKLLLPLLPFAILGTCRVGRRTASMSAAQLLAG